MAGHLSSAPSPSMFAQCISPSPLVIIPLTFNREWGEKRDEDSSEVLLGYAKVIFENRVEGCTIQMWQA